MMLRKFWFGMVVLIFLLSACEPSATVIAPTAGVPPTPEVRVITPTATIPPTPAPRSLVVCLGQEPQSLYLYKSSSRSMWSVLEAIYDGPIDTLKFTPQPVILDGLPDFTRGTAVNTPVDVKAGDAIVDANGNLANLAAGMKVVPAGCTKSDCAITWDGKSPLQMDQLSLTYTLLPNIRWSDGTPLTSADSVYSYELSADPATPVNKRLIDRTAGYKAKDDQTVLWTGLPGYAPAQLESFFWIPLPKHVYSKLKPADLLNADVANMKPIGWGPYNIDEWVAGDHIKLSKNPNYFKASAGLPKFDTLVFRFLGQQGDNNVTALLSGECDIVDTTTLLEDQLERISNLKSAGKLKAYVGLGPDWEHLDFGIQTTNNRPDFFGDLRVRQAFAYCLDRQQVINRFFFGFNQVPGGYMPPDHPLFQADLKPAAFDPTQGAKLLDEAGWKVEDQTPGVARVARGVKGVPDGTPFKVIYQTTEAALRKQVVEVFAQSLARCGIQISVQYNNPGQMFAAGPDGTVFGRKFDLAQFAWQSPTLPMCYIYSTSQIPADSNHWIGSNVTGFSSKAYDDACAAAQQNRPWNAEAYKTGYQAVEKLFAEQMPVIPLYYHPVIAVSRPDLCGLSVDVSARSGLWNLESLDYGSTCH